MQLGRNKPTDSARDFNVILMLFACKRGKFLPYKTFLLTFFYRLHLNFDLLSSCYLLIKITSLKTVLCVA